MKQKLLSAEDVDALS